MANSSKKRKLNNWFKGGETYDSKDVHDIKFAVVDDEF